MDNLQLKLLIVDDEPGIIDFISKVYRRKGFTTLGATDGVSAVEIFRNERPHITLLDVHMPFSAIDGVETLKKIREIDNNAICIMLTRVTEQEKIDLSKQSGSYAYLLKPMDVEELDAAIEKAKTTLTQSQ